MRAVIAAFAAATLASPSVARAEPPAADDVRVTASSEEAKSHFQEALVQYRAGKYRSAISELQKAYEVDPTGKDLVYNLAIVYEKLGELDSAIHYLERYVALEPDPDEVKRADAAIQRLRGARAELQHAAESRVATRCPPAPARASPPSGRFDEWVAVTGGVAIVSAVLGTVLGLSALDTQPSADDVTGAGESREEMRERASTAASLARFADVAFGVSIVSGSAAAVLYFGRSTEGAVESSGGQPAGRTAPAITTIGVRGRF